MSLQELYRGVILDHYRNPRRRGKLTADHIHTEGKNPSCGDEFALDVIIENGVVIDSAIQGQGCSISQASGSMMADAIIGKTLDEVQDLAHTFKVMMTIEEGENPIDPEVPRQNQMCRPPLDHPRRRPRTSHDVSRVPSSAGVDRMAIPFPGREPPRRTIDRRCISQRTRRILSPPTSSSKPRIRQQIRAVYRS